MRPADDVRHVPWLRYALLAAALTAAWLVISLFSSAPSASADEHDTGSGLLGGVGSLLGGVASVTGGVGDTLGDVAPEPVAEVAPVVVDTATDAANTTISGTNTAVGTLGNGVTATLSDVAAGGTVGAVVTPITGLVDGVAGGLPIVGDLVGDNAVSGVVSPVTGLVDDALGSVIGSAGELPTDGTGILPQLPRIPLLPGGSDSPGDPGEPAVVTTPATSTGGPPGSLGAADTSTESASRALVSSSAAYGLAEAITPADGGAPPSGDLPASPAAPAGGSASGGAGSGGAGGASGTSDAAFAALELDALASLVLHSVDDALPSSPVFDTDTTPD
jgi:hypothetical protein